jgi:hypothetical protein
MFVSKGGHEPARARLGASHVSACENLALLGLARWSFGLKKWARPKLAKNSVQLELARDELCRYMKLYSSNLCKEIEPLNIQKKIMKLHRMIIELCMNPFQ